MKTLLILLLTVISAHAATVAIGDTGYEMEYGPSWRLLPDSTRPRTSWAFSDDRREFVAGVMITRTGSADGIEAKDLVSGFSETYKKSEEMELAPGFKAFRFTNPDGKMVLEVSCIVEEKYTILVTVEGDSARIAAAEADVRAFLTGLKKK